MKSIRDIPVRHQLVFVRVDFNVPLDDAGNITEDGRIKAVLPTIEYLLEKEARVVLASHLGRPKGKVVDSLRLRPVAKRLSELLGQQVEYVDDCIGKEVEAAKQRLEPGEVLLLENLRFYPQEKENDLRFAEQLAQGIDVYIQDAFGALHREHASTHALPSLVFDKGIGFLVEEELGALGKIIENPDQPFVVVIGGIKISDKVDVIRNLAPMADVVLVGGGVANTFIKALGNDIGASIVESDSAVKGEDTTDYVAMAHEIWNRFETEKPTIDVTLPDESPLTKIVVPVDFVAAPNTEHGSITKVIEIGKDEMPEGWRFLDIGPKTRDLYAEILKKARTIFWNGPMGLFEMDEYARGSQKIALAIAESDGYAVLGGGDTEVVVDKFGLHGRFSHISTGGGASLTFLAQKPLPGLTALE
jgi:phosphoglycerate kinase